MAELLLNAYTALTSNKYDNRNTVNVASDPNEVLQGQLQKKLLDILPDSVTDLAILVLYIIVPMLIIYVTVIVKITRNELSDLKASLSKTTDKADRLVN